jgi:hypothetical protein
MVVRIRSFLATIFAAVILFLGAASASAQCTQVTVISNLPGAVNLTLANGGGNPHPSMIIPSGVSTHNLQPGFVIAGFNGVTGIYHPFTPQPPKPACALTGTGDLACTGFYGTGKPFSFVGCASICYDDVACTITLTWCPANELCTAA